MCATEEKLKSIHNKEQKKIEEGNPVVPNWGIQKEKAAAADAKKVKCVKCKKSFDEKQMKGKVCKECAKAKDKK
jgi:protein-arginine kinase activator protein McsA